MNYGIDDRIVHSLQAMGYRWRYFRSEAGYFCKPIGHGCLIFKNGCLEMVFDALDLSLAVWASSPIDLSLESSVLRQIMIAESHAIDGAKFDRHSETFAFLSTEQSIENLM